VVQNKGVSLQVFRRGGWDKSLAAVPVNRQLSGKSPKKPTTVVKKNPTTEPGDEFPNYHKKGDEGTSTVGLFVHNPWNWGRGGPTGRGG